MTHSLLQLLRRCCVFVLLIIALTATSITAQDDSLYEELDDINTRSGSRDEVAKPAVTFNDLRQRLQRTEAAPTTNDGDAAYEPAVDAAPAADVTATTPTAAPSTIEYAASTDGENVIQLTSVNLQSHIDSMQNSASNDPWSGLLINYCTDTDPQCREFQSVWNQIGDEMAVMSNFDVGVVDCTKQSQLCSQQGVTTYPTVKLLLRGQDAQEVVTAERSIDGILSHVEQAVALNVQQLQQKLQQQQQQQSITNAASEAEISPSNSTELSDTTIDEPVDVQPIETIVQAVDEQLQDARANATISEPVRLNATLSTDADISEDDITNSAAAINGTDLLADSSSNAMVDFASSKVTELDLVAYESTLALLDNFDAVVVYFYSDNSDSAVHARQLIDSASRPSSDNQIVYTAVNCTEQADLCAAEHIRVYPTLLLFQPNYHTEAHYPTQSQQSIDSFVHRHVSEATAVLHSKQQQQQQRIDEEAALQAKQLQQQQQQQLADEEAARIAAAEAATEVVEPEQPSAASPPSQPAATPARAVQVAEQAEMAVTSNLTASSAPPTTQPSQSQTTSPTPSPAVATELVRTLIPTNLDATFEQKPLTFVTFYSNGCAHSKQILQNLETVAEQISGTPLHQNVTFGKVDCDVYPTMCVAAKLKHTPFHVLHNHQRGNTRRYFGAVNQPSITKLLQFNALPKIVPINDVGDWQLLTSNFSSTPTLLACDPTGTDSNFQQKIATAADLLHSHTDRSDCDIIVGLANEFAVCRALSMDKSQPSVTFRNAVSSVQMSWAPNAQRENATQLATLVRKLTWPPMIELFTTQPTASPQQLRELRTPVVYIFSDGTQSSMYEGLAELYRNSYTFTHISLGQAKQQLAYFNVTDEYASARSTILLIEDRSVAQQPYPIYLYPADAPVDQRHITEWLDGGTSKQLKPTLAKRTQSLSRQQLDITHSPRTLNSDNLQTLLQSAYLNDQSVFLNIYSPYCAHCKHLNRTWQQLGQLYANDNKVIIAEIDGSKNDISIEYNKYPTLMLVRPSGEEVPYRKTRTLDALQQFVRHHTTPHDVLSLQSELRHSVVSSTEARHDEL